MNETLRGIEIIKKYEILISYWEKIQQNPYVLQIAANGWCCYLAKEEEGGSMGFQMGICILLLIKCI